MNWGVKIFLTLAVFMVGFVLVGIYMVSKNTDTLEHDDYYERGINYDAVYERRQNLQEQRAQPTISISDDTLSVRFVHAGNSGKVYLRRASDRSQDTEVIFSVAGDLWQWPTDSLIRGAWNLELEWKSGSHEFQYEEQVFLDVR